MKNCVVFSELQKAKMPMFRSPQRLYNQLIISNSEANSFRVLICGVTLLSLFAMLVIEGTSTFLGIVIGDPIFARGAGSLLIMAFVVVELTFFCCCKINENSEKILEQSSFDLRRKKDEGFIRRIVFWLRPVSDPAGNVGIFDKMIKRNYCNSVLNNKCYYRLY